MRYLFFLILIFLSQQTIGQTNDKLCKAVTKEKFNKVGRLFKKEMKRLDKITSNDINAIDSLTQWLAKSPCVKDIMSDKCEIKIAIYPGWSVVGAIFYTENGLMEKCFKIQRGTTGAVNIFGWKPHIFKPKDKLVFKNVYDCPGFVEKQKKNCFDIKK